jgi:hypothetical protein
MIELISFSPILGSNGMELNFMIVGFNGAKFYAASMTSSGLIIPDVSGTEFRLAIFASIQ